MFPQDILNDLDKLLKALESANEAAAQPVTGDQS